MQLGKSYIEDIERICRAADDYVAEGNNDEAYRKYKEALDIIPEPKTAYETATWIFVSIGDLYFKTGRYDLAKDYFYEAKECPNGVSNPYVLFRLGQSLVETNDEKDAKEFLLRAYMLVGDDIFWDEDEKYYNVIKEMIKIDETDSDIL
ncbi:MAG: tetratricopeptide repeat protein [Clostridia bacterium]|jgi:tetratricopeptide (TPR) repeat protein|nr:tetratricopeptide repeat protein [Clostridia bacterium]